jgi:hypothetical protein
MHDADRAEALARVRRWRAEWPRLCHGVRDADGCPPAHTFFYPIEQYDAEILAELSCICRENHAEVEIHLHHDRDTAENLRACLKLGKTRLTQHGLLSRDPQGRVRYGFIHGNWALDDSDPRGCGCGVRNELSVLAETGCYADFTMPSAPHPTQTSTINRIYYALDTPAPKSHDRGIPMRVGGSAPTPDALLLVQGPLGLNWRRRKWGVVPRLENAELAGANPPALERFRLWLDIGVHVAGRPEWVVMKLHTHGGIPRNMEALLGHPAGTFHRDLATQFHSGTKFRLHYVTARELVNILYAAEAGMQGNPGGYRDYRLLRV